MVDWWMNGWMNGLISATYNLGEKLTPSCQCTRDESWANPSAGRHLTLQSRQAKKQKKRNLAKVVVWPCQSEGISYPIEFFWRELKLKSMCKGQQLIEKSQEMLILCSHQRRLFFFSIHVSRHVLLGHQKIIFMSHLIIPQKKTTHAVCWNFSLSWM